MDILWSLALIDWFALLALTSLVVCVLGAEAERFADYRRKMGVAMLMLVISFVTLLMFTDPGESYFLSFGQEKTATKKKPSRGKKVIIDDGENKDPNEEASGPGDGDGGQGEGPDLQLASAKGLNPDGSLPGGASGKGKKQDGGGKKSAVNLVIDNETGEGDGGEIEEEIEIVKGQKKLKVVRDCEFCPAMVLVKPGSFILGSDPQQVGYRRHEGPRKEVTIRRPFWIGRFEVTRSEFDKFVTASDYQSASTCVIDARSRSNRNFRAPAFAQTGEHPVVCISWHDAKAYAAWVSQLSGRVYRLPSETEWEFAVRSGTSTNFSWGDDFYSLDANFGLVTKGTTTVGSYIPNPIGLYDAAGNVWEMVEDCWAPNLEQRPTDGSAFVVDKCKKRVIKGGSWYNSPRYLRSASRWAHAAAASGNGVGFRIVRELPADPVVAKAKR